MCIRGVIKIGLVLPLEPSNPCLENDSAVPFALHHLRISPWLWFRILSVRARIVRRICLGVRQKPYPTQEPGRLQSLPTQWNMTPTRHSRESGNPRLQRLGSHFLQAVGWQSNNFAIVLTQERKRIDKQRRPALSSNYPARNLLVGRYGECRFIIGEIPERPILSGIS